MKKLMKLSQLLFLTLKEVVMMNELRGYEGVLEPTLIRSNMQEHTLTAMIEAMLEFRHILLSI